jgi:hypothetical protein
MTQDVSARPWTANFDHSAEAVVSVVIGDLAWEKNSLGNPETVRRVLRPTHNSMMRLAVLNALRPASLLPRN